MTCLVIPLLTRLRLSHLDGIVAAHAIVRIHKPLAADSPYAYPPLLAESNGN